MDSPDFGTRMNVEKRQNFVRITPGDDNHSRPAVAYDLLQEARNSGIWICLIALGMEWRQRSVVIDQQYRLRSLGEGLQKRRELRFHFWPQRAAPFLLLDGSRTSKSECIRLGAKFLLRVLGRIQADLAKFRDQVPGPAVNIALLNELAHAVHAQLFVFRLHL